MDDLQLVAELARDTRLLDAEELASARDRLVAAIHEERAGDERPARPAWRHRRVRRFMLAGWATAGVAAAAAVAVLVGATGVPDRAGAPVLVADVQAVQVLQNAAAAALKLPDVEPRANQFIYQKTQTGAETRETWNSVDGTRDGQATTGAQKDVFPGCRNGRRAAIKGDQVIGTEPCTPEPAYLPDLPTEVDAMLAYVKQLSGSPGDVNAMGKNVMDLAEFHYLRPAARAALFRAAAKIPGLRMIPRATDGAGRPGVGIAWTFEGGMAPGSQPGDRDIELIFDAKTYAFLGVSAGRVSTAMMAVAVVDEVGQRR